MKQGPVGPSSGFMVYRNEGVSVGGGEIPILTASSVAAGSYVFEAELDATTTGGGSWMTCHLTVGSAQTRTELQIMPNGFWGSEQHLSINLAATLDAPTDAVLSCYSSGPTVTAQWRRITAIKVGSVTVTHADGP